MQIWSESATVCLLACRVFNLCPCIPVHLNWQLLGRRRRSPRDFKKTSLIRRRNYRPGGGPPEGSVYCLQSHGCCCLPSDTAQYVKKINKKITPTHVLLMHQWERPAAFHLFAAAQWGRAHMDWSTNQVHRDFYINQMLICYISHPFFLMQAII